MNLKTGVTRKQSRPNVPKNENFLPFNTYTCVCVSGDKECSFFGKLGVLCSFCNTRFEVRPSALLPTIMLLLTTFEDCLGLRFKCCRRPAKEAIIRKK